MSATTLAERITQELVWSKENDLAKIATFQEKIAKGQSIRQAMEWGEEVVLAEIHLGFVLQIERAVENGHALIQVLHDLKERMEESLLGNRFTRSSTSEFHRAVEGAEAEATSRSCFIIRNWLKGHIHD